jgi:hypothetical protein
MSNDRPTGEEIAFRGLANSHQPTEREIQAGIDQAMAEVIRHDARHNPNALSPPVTVTPVGHNELRPRTMAGRTRSPSVCRRAKT